MNDYERTQQEHIAWQIDNARASLRRARSYQRQGNARLALIHLNDAARYRRLATFRYLTRNMSVFEKIDFWRVYNA